MVKPEFRVSNVFLTEPVGVIENLEGREALWGGLYPQPPDKSGTGEEVD